MANHPRVLRKLFDLTQMRWEYKSGQYHCATRGASNTLLQELLENTYGLGFKEAGGMLSISDRQAKHILAAETQFPDLKSLLAAAEAFVGEKEAKAAAAKAAAAPPPPLGDEAVLDLLHKGTKLTWSIVDDGSSPMNGKIATQGVSHKLAVEQQRKCATKGLQAEIEDVRDKHHLTVTPEAAQEFARKRVKRHGASHAERASERTDFGIA